MKAIMVMYDSLNRLFLEPYGSDWTLTPNFRRLAERSVQFDQCYVCSMPCMPARRELQTGRSNFLHRSWGPMEPYDDSMPELLKQSGIYTHLVSDHQHYWEDGGATYHTRYSSWEISRGQEGDPWQPDPSCRFDRPSIFEARKAQFEHPWIGPLYRAMMSFDEANRRYMDTEEKTPQAVTFRQGISFLDHCHDQDNWFLQIETFDPHEPFYVMKEDRDLYPHDYSFVGDAVDDWPPYAHATESPEVIDHVRKVYAALVSKCDRYLGQVLDRMDAYDLWKDTMLIVCTDHGFLLGEHGWWGKSAMPLYDEIAHTPLFIYDPRTPELQGVRRRSLVQMIDLAPTLLDFFSVPIPKDMLGQPLKGIIRDDTPIREYAVFGYHGSQINVTDGRYTYMHSAEHPELPAYDYTLMPTHMRSRFSPAELKDAELTAPFSFTKECPLLKILPQQSTGDTTAYGSALYDIQEDPAEEHPLDDPEIIERMKAVIYAFMQANDAPKELYARLFK